MKNKNPNRESIQRLTMGGILTALVIILQLMGQFIHLGPFSISLVLLPIVIGSALCGYKVGAWLGFVFGIAVLMTDASAFLAVSIPGTVITVLLKGIACGFAAGFTYKLFEKKNRTLAVTLSAIICPIVNTGIFILGCFLFFFEAIASWGASEGYESTLKYLLFGMIGLNFLVEFAVNIFLCPTAIKLINIGKKTK